MTTSARATNFELCLLCYPYYPSRDTGRGHDRYVFELQHNITKALPEVKLHLSNQGFSEGILAAGTKQFKLIADLLSSKADLYHAISPIGGATAALLGKAPLVVTIHDLIPFQVGGYEYSWKSRYARFCTGVSVRKSDAIIVPYRVTKDEIVSRFRVPASKIHVVNYGVDHATYYPRSEEKRSAKQVLYIGEVSRSKGVDTLIRAFSIVEKTIGDVELVIGGKKSRDQPMLESLSRELGVSNVRFRGFIPEGELPRYYSSAAVMIFPSRYGFGLSTLEAMACGTPVIVGAVLDAPEFVADAGILVNPDDSEELAQSMIRVLTAPGLKEQLSAKAIERAKDFSWEKMAGETAKIYAQYRAQPLARMTP
jgi:glycosyltransferase involved in cell wall biosynthesis